MDAEDLIGKKRMGRRDLGSAGGFPPHSDAPIAPVHVDLLVTKGNIPRAALMSFNCGPPVSIFQRRPFALKDRNHISINTLMLLGARATLRRLESRLTENSFPFPTNILELLGLAVASSFGAPGLAVP